MRSFNSQGIANKGQLIIVEPGEVELKQVIGQGAFGCVYSAIWCPPGEQRLEIPVAVKQLKNDVKLQNQNVELLEEAKLMASVNHDNLVRLIAISMNEPMMLITKFMTHGASLQFITSHKGYMIHRNYNILFNDRGDESYSVAQLNVQCSNFDIWLY